jgi:hypothetical protein
MNKTVFCAHPLKRQNYFAGRLPTVDDFRGEQNYYREKQRRHNLHCHGFGVLQGLKISTVDENSGWAVVIEPGFAIDPVGNEIQLCNKTEFQLPQSQAAIQVGIRFAERLCDPVPVAPADDTTLSSQPLHVQEGVEVLLIPLLRAARTKTRVLASRQDVVTLGRLVRNKGAWKVDRKFKVPRAH